MSAASGPSGHQADSSGARSGAGESKQPLLILGAVILVIVLLAYFGNSRPIERTAIGFGGLEIWLKSNGFEVEDVLQQGEDGSPTVFRILPLYDPQPGNEGYDLTDGREGVAGELVPRAMSETDLIDKLEVGPVLAIMPKWRGGIVGRGRAHPDLLVPAHLIDIFDIGVKRLSDLGLADYAVNGTNSGLTVNAPVSLYAAQVFTPGPDFRRLCEPLLTLEDAGTLLAQCWGGEDSIYDHPIYVLSDPDLLDNHGLRLGENAAVALTLIGNLAGDQPIFIDRDAEESRAEDASGTDPHVRSLADLKRFFVYPFSFFWIGVVALTGLALWRGSRGFGRPVDDDPAEASDASKVRTIEASQRILLLAGENHALVRTYVEDRLEALAGALLGPHAPRDDQGGVKPALDRFLSRRAPNLGERLNSTYQALRHTTENTISTDQMRQLSAFEAVIEEIWNEFGRAASPSRPNRR
ncbi:hypothetical protein [Fulvimarina sp. MAC3]|uniref:hypothetical protein n=1 Tax=Fulvimarina sp. MAC3 TaxID=3148887 RepID=UPI0031FCE762